MKIKIDTFVEDISTFDNAVFMDESQAPIERLSINLIGMNHIVSELALKLASLKSKTIIFIDDENNEENFDGFVLENVRKTYTGQKKQITIDFFKSK